jgi:hypothetical protein
MASIIPLPAHLKGGNSRTRIDRRFSSAAFTLRQELEGVPWSIGYNGREDGSEPSQNRSHQDEPAALPAALLSAEGSAPFERRLPQI